MSYLQENLELLESCYPGIRKEVLSEYNPSLELEIVETEEATDLGNTALRSGTPGLTVRYKTKYLHSKRNPRREAVRLVSQSNPEQPVCCVFLGLGLGYHIEEFRRRYPDSEVIIVEPDIPLFLALLEVRNFSEVFNGINVNLLLAADAGALLPLLEPFRGNDIAIIHLRSVYEKDQEYYQEIERLISRARLRGQINFNTLKRFGKLWVKNLARNLPLLAQAPPVKNLENRFMGYPALLLAAGPGLDKVLPFIKALRERMLIVAVDTALPALTRYGLQPDFAIVVDPQYWNSRHLDRVDSGSGPVYSGSNPVINTQVGPPEPDTPPELGQSKQYHRIGTTKGIFTISESSTHPRVFRLLDGSFFFTSSLFPLGRYFERFTGEKGKLGAGGSVATTAWDFCRFIGCDRIYTAGLDLGFPGYKTHCSGSFFEERSHSLSNRFKPAETASFSYVYSGGAFLGKNYSGGEGLTDKRMSLYQWWFEQQAQRYSDIESVSLNPEALKITGFKYTAVDRLLSMPVIRKQIDVELSQISRMFMGKEEKKVESKPEGMDSITSLEKGLRDLLSSLEDLGALATEALEANEELEKRRSGASFTHDQSVSSRLSGLTDIELLSKLDCIDGEILNRSERDIVSFLIQDIIREIESSDAGGADSSGSYRQTKTSDKENWKVQRGTFGLVGDASQERRESSKNKTGMQGLKNSRRLYSGIAESAEFHLKELEKGLMRLS